MLPKGPHRPILFLAGCEVGATPRLVQALSQRMPNILIVASQCEMTPQSEEAINGIAQVGYYKMAKNKKQLSHINFTLGLNGKAYSDAHIFPLSGYNYESFTNLVLHYGSSNGTEREG